MMNIANILLLGVMISLFVVVIIRAGRVSQAELKRRMLSNSYRTAIDSYDGVGISLMCCSVNRQRIEHLLAVEYPHYEVVAVVDANDDYELFRQIIERFAMVKVSRSSSYEVSAVGVRALYRSRHRRFRRLILVDKLHTTYHDGLNAATCYCSYEHLLPLPDGCWLVSDAIERLVVALAECEGEDKSVVCSRSGTSALLYTRDDIVATGGFDIDSLNHIPRSKRVYIDEPIFRDAECNRTLVQLAFGVKTYSCGCNSSGRQRMEVWLTRILTLLSLLSLVVLSAWMGVPILLAALLTVALVLSVAYYVATLSATDGSQNMREEKRAREEEKLAQ